MILQGLKLTMLGMMVVFSFLALLLIVIHISARLLKPYTQKETSVRFKVAGKGRSQDHPQKLAAIVSAAIAAHRANLKT